MGVGADTASTAVRDSFCMGWGQVVISIGRVPASIRPARAGFIKFRPSPP